MQTRSVVPSEDSNPQHTASQTPILKEDGWHIFAACTAVRCLAKSLLGQGFYGN